MKGDGVVVWWCCGDDFLGTGKLVRVEEDKKKKMEGAKHSAPLEEDMETQRFKSPRGMNSFLKQLFNCMHPGQ